MVLLAFRLLSVFLTVARIPPYNLPCYLIITVSTLSFCSVLFAPNSKYVCSLISSYLGLEQLNSPLQLYPVTPAGLDGRNATEELGATLIADVTRLVQATKLIFDVELRITLLSKYTCPRFVEPAPSTLMPCIAPSILHLLNLERSNSDQPSRYS